MGVGIGTISFALIELVGILSVGILVGCIIGLLFKL